MYRFVWVSFVAVKGSLYKRTYSDGKQDNDVEHEQKVRWVADLVNLSELSWHLTVCFDICAVYSHVSMTQRLPGVLCYLIAALIPMFSPVELLASSLQPLCPPSLAQGTPPPLRPDLSEQILVKLPMSCIGVIACQTHSTDANLRGRKWWR